MSLRVESKIWRLLPACFAALCLFALGWGCSSSPRDLKAIAKVKSDEDSQEVTLFGSDVTDAELQQLAEFDQIKSLTLQECPQVSDDGLVVLEKLDGLETLKLIRVPISDVSLSHLRSSDVLSDLQLAHTEVTGGGLEHLADAPLVRLSLHSHMVTPEGLEALPKLVSLRELELQCPSITFTQLPALEPLADLETLVAYMTPVGTGGMEKIRNLKNLRTLQLDGRGVKDKGVLALNTLTSLESLELTNADITNQALKEIALPELKKLSLSGCTQLTDEGLKNLEGVDTVEYLNLVDTGVAGRDLTGLAVIPTLREVVLSSGQFKGGREAIAALKMLLPECEVVITQG